MGAGVKHSTAVSDGTPGEPADWNAEHDYDASLTTDAFKFVWKDTPNQVLTLANQTSGSGSYQPLDLTSTTSANAKTAYLKLSLIVDTVGAGTTCGIKVRKYGTVPVSVPEVTVNKDEGSVGGLYVGCVLVGMDSAQRIEYFLEVGSGWQVDASIDVLGYLE